MKDTKALFSADKAKSPKTYVALVRKYARPVPRYDDKGKPVVQHNPDGSVKYVDGVPLQQVRLITFTAYPSKMINGSKIDSCFYATDSKIEQELLDGDVKDPGTSVMFLEDFNRKLNPLADNQRQRADKAEAEVARLTALLRDAEKNPVIVEQSAKLSATGKKG